MRKVLPIVLLAMAMSCGTSVTPDPLGGENDLPGPGSNRAKGRISGTVWAPGNAPGMVPAGHEIPVHEALVYVTNDRPGPIPQETYCDSCNIKGDLFGLSDYKGHFEIEGIPEGNYWLVIEKAQFRIEREIVVRGEFANELPQDFTTLPSQTNASRGEWAPRIAIASGSYDALEDILGKMGFGEVGGDGGYVANSAAGYFDVYSNGGALDGVAVGTLGDLVSDLQMMLQYHIILVPCSGDSWTSKLNDTKVLQNIREYVGAGGKLYVTDWSGEWADNVFPAQVALGSDVDTPGSAYNASSGTWNTTQFGDADGFGQYDSTGSAVDDDLRQWLDGQQGPLVAGGTGPINASSFTVADNWNVIESLTSVNVGVDENGSAVIDDPITWVQGTASGGVKPLTVTYEPTGCGRVLFSTYHTTDDTHVGLKPQERVLLYLLMEIGECKQGPIAVE